MDTTHSHDAPGHADPGVPQAYVSPWKGPGGVNSWLVVVVGVVGTMIVAVIFTAADAWYRNMRRTHEIETAYRQMDGELKRYAEEQHRRLNTPHYTQDDRKLVAIPIEQGMEAYLQSRGLQSGSR